MKGGKFKIGVLVVVVTVGLAAGFAEAAEKMQYRLKLEKGKKYYVQMITEGKIFYTLRGRERPVEEMIGFGYNFDVNEIDRNGNHLVDCTFDWIKLNKNAPGSQIVYDSTQLFSPVHPLAKRLHMLLGQRFQIKTTPEGNVLNVKGLGMMFRNIDRKFGRRKNEKLVIQSLKEQYKKESIKELFETYLAIYPKNSVAVGDSWRKTTVNPHGKPVIVEDIWTLTERKDGIAIIQNKADIRPDPNVKPMVRGGTETSYKLKGTQNGLIEVEESTGLIRQSKLNEELTGEMKIETTGEVATEQIIPMKVQNVVTFQMTERKKEADQEKEVVQ